MAAIRFTIPGEPLSQPRQSIRTFNRAGGKGPIATAYLPKSHPVNTWKAIVVMAARQAYQGPPLEGPIRLSMVFVMPRTKGQTKPGKAMPRLWHTKRPDRDNLQKAVKDALTGVVWGDDSQVCSGPCDKVIASGDEQPRCEVTIEQITEAP